MSVYTLDFKIGHKKHRAFDEQEVRTYRHYVWGAIAGAAIGVIGGAVNANQQKKAAQGAAYAAQQAGGTTPTVDIAALQKQAQDVAQQNAATSAALEQQYNPGASALRTASLSGLTNSLAPNGQLTALGDRIAAQAGTAPSASYDSPLLRQAIAQASGDLSLGGRLSLDTQNAATRHALATAGSVSGGPNAGLGLGRDLQARDLGLTSLQLEQQRLNTAAQLGQQEAGLGQGNAQLSLQSQLAGQQNLFNSGNFIQNLMNGQFAKQLSAAQLGQNIAAPASGLDPGTIANLAVGNTNATAAANQQDKALAIAQANQKSILNGQLTGVASNLVTKYLNSPSSTPAQAATPAGSSYGDMGSYMNSFYGS